MVMSRDLVLGLTDGDGVVLSSPERTPPHWAGNGNPGLRGALDVRYGFPHAQAVPGDARWPVATAESSARSGTSENFKRTFENRIRNL